MVIQINSVVGRWVGVDANSFERRDRIRIARGVVQDVAVIENFVKAAGVVAAANPLVDFRPAEACQFDIQVGFIDLEIATACRRPLS